MIHDETQTVAQKSFRQGIVMPEEMGLKEFIFNELAKKLNIVKQYPWLFLSKRLIINEHFELLENQDELVIVFKAQ